MKKHLLISGILAATACAAYAQTSPAEQKAVPAIKVEKIVTAASVKKREPVGGASSFDSATTQIYTWTKITVAQVPEAIKHVYYHNGKMVREITLSVHTSPYRGWSVKNVTPGNWRVDVTDEAGTVLATAEFTVGEPAPEAVK